LVPKVAAASRLPVLAAGGIVTGEDLVKVLSMGAQGAVIGTALLATRESFAHDYHKQRLIAAREGDTLLTCDFHINWPAGAKVRVLNNSVTRGERGEVAIEPPAISLDRIASPCASNDAAPIRSGAAPVAMAD
jgi:nitronate monooxygenase